MNTRPKTPVPTERVLVFMEAYFHAHDRLPTMRRIAKQFKWKSHYSSKHHIDKLVAQGKLERTGIHIRFPRP